MDMQADAVAAPEFEPHPAIEADIAPSFTYASYQNAVPVVRAITIANRTGRAYEHCVVELSSTPPFLRPKRWMLDRLLPGDVIALTDRRVELDASYLAGLNEAERGEIVLRLSGDGETFVEQHVPVRLLARDEWGGVADMAQLLPAFVMPNDPAIAAILRSAAERLSAHGHASGLDGYQSGSPQRAFLLAAAVYSAVAGLGLHYAEPPASFEQRGQKVRRPTTIAGERLATCLDTTLLFAAALEAVGLNSVLMMFQGHSSAGVWLLPRQFANAIEPDAGEIRKALAGGELIVFETTGVTHRPAMTLEAAQRLLEARLEEERAHEFVAAIDVRRARSGGIVPLASHAPPPAGEAPADEASETAPLPLPAAPVIVRQLPETVEVKPTSAAGRIDRWQRKLLDLTLRNRLLNFPDSKKTIPFLCPDVAYLEDRLAKGAAIRIVSLPEQNPLGERDAALYRDVHGRDLQRGFAADALARDELPSLLDAKHLDARLTELYRAARDDLAEGGANTLFLAVGFLRWKKKPTDERSYRAPLLLVPVKLERRSASSRFSLRFHEDEPRFNATLLQFLDRDFQLKLPQFEDELPADDSGIDVPRLIAMMRQAVRDVPGMEVVDEVSLSTFSFAKFLMWKDLVERTDALRNNRVVKHLIDTPDKTFEDAGTFRHERELDSSYAPADIVNLLPADSSQTAASLAAAEGRDFVIVGPPGTGKSQTIANMIANCLAVGKTVLFVAEKTAALDVVYRRLREHGLGDHCLELHSNKADRRRFLAQLKASWENGGRVDSSQWVTINERLRLRRDELNAYVAALHRRHPNGWSAYQAMGVTLRNAASYAPTLTWSSEGAPDSTALAEAEQIAGEIGLAFASVRMHPALAMVDVPDWTSAWQDELLAAGEALNTAADVLGKAIAACLASLGQSPKEDAATDEIDALVRLARALQDSAGHDVSVLGDRDLAALRPALAALEQAIAAYSTARRQLSAVYDARALAELDPAALEQQWRQANAAIWPASLLGKKKVQKLLQGYVAEGTADPERDLPLLHTMKDCEASVAANALAGKPLPFSGLTTDTARIAGLLDLAEGLRAVLRLPHLGQEENREVLRAVVPLLSGATDTHVRPSADRLLAAHRNFEAALRRFGELAGKPATLSGSNGQLVTLRAGLAGLREARPLLRDWSSWCRVRRSARNHGLAPLVESVEAGRLAGAETAASFRLAYARWWLPTLLDTDPVLRNFRRFQHENAIADFRELDDLVRAHATHRVASTIAHGLPAADGVPRQSELGMLRHQMSLQRPSRSIRDMIGSMPTSFTKLAPCMMMSPLSIAQYLPPNHTLFDVVIFDEASQITTWDAIGAIARARQTVIVGDPKQLPPTNFFGRNEDEEEVEEHEKDLESILDEVQAAGIPLRDLRWHYRSRSESLIAFSNHHYYQNRLVTFPSPSVEDRAVRLRKVTEGVYDRGKSRTNRMEAQALVAEAAGRLRGWLKLEEKARPTLGIITFNAQQQALIRDLLDLVRRDEPELEWFFAEERIEPVIVKNLENVQGDERDVILFSITYTQDSTGRRNMDFGALNRDGGERRLNVAVTRARQELAVFSGFTADLIDPSRAKGLGVHHLKAFLDYAERGAVALPAQDRGSLGGFESVFEEAVAGELVTRGWIVVPQVGISGFRVDLGIRHPDRPGAYLAGVECDGATYHSSATARDRDKVREQVLRGLGWRIERVWSTDWWFDSSGCAERLNAELAQMLAEDRERRARQEAEETERQAGEDATGDAIGIATHWDMGHEVEPLEPLAEEAPESEDTPSPCPSEPDDAELVAVAVMTEAAQTSAPEITISRVAKAATAPLPATTDVAPPDMPTPAMAVIQPVEMDVDTVEAAEPSSNLVSTSQLPDAADSVAAPLWATAGDSATLPADSAGRYHLADLSGFAADPDRYYDFDYRHTLRAMISAIIAEEAPLRADLLAQRIARAHGWLRTGGKIRERIDIHLRETDTTAESSGIFVWQKGSISSLLPYRPPLDADSRRGIGDIPLAELASLVVANSDLLDQSDPALDLARLLGVERLAAVSRARLDEAIHRAKEHLLPAQSSSV